MDYVYSANGEDGWSDDYDEVRNDAVDNLFPWRTSNESADSVTIYRGEKETVSHSEFVHADSIIEQIQESAAGEFWDFSYGYLDDLNQADRRELELKVIEFLLSRAALPTFYRVKNIDSEVSHLTSDELTSLQGE